MQRTRLIIMVAVVVLLPFLLLAGSFYYKTEMELTPVVTEASANGEAELTVYMIGEPAWPFGPTDCRFDLYVDNKRVVKYPFSIHNDGVSASANNFTVTWKNDHVEILATAEEQFPVTYILYFDGNVGAHQEEYP